MARGKKNEDALTPEEKLAQALVPDWNQPYKVPKNWSWVNLESVASLHNGDRGVNYPSKKDYVEIGIPFINAGAIQNNALDEAEFNYITEEKFESLRAGKIQKGDILYCLRGSLGKTAVVENDTKGAISSSLCILRCNGAVLRKYFLEDAIQQQKKVIFYYYDLNENGEKVYRRQGHHYVVEPVALVFNEDNYYLMVYSAKHDNTANYRVDRMEKVEIIDDSICEKALALRDSIGGYTEQAFKMYGGQLQEITIQFENCLIGAVYDKFGEDTQMLRISDTTCEATVEVQISPTFWGWIFQFGKQMRITSPNEMIVAYNKQIAQLLDIGSNM